MMTFYIIGMIISILLEWYYFSLVRKGAEIDSYPKHYFKLSPYKLFREWFLWATIWPLVLSVGIITNIIGAIKK